MAKQSLKDIIKLEYQKCAGDPIYFMKKYCMIQHPVRGKIPFHLYQFQERTLDQFAEHRYNIILKSRQTGISTLTAGFSLWKMLFNQDFNVLVIATKQEVAKNLVTKVRVMNQYLPSWLKQNTVEDNKLSLRYSNGSQIKATSAAGDAGRSEALSLLVFDEAAFIDKIEDIWVSAQSTLSTGGNAIILSTPNGVGNFFHKTWVGAEEETNTFNTIRLHWSVHPERNQSWRDEQEVLLGPKGAALECDCDFVSSLQLIFSERIKNVPTDWDLLYFGGVHETRGGLFVPEEVSPNVLRCKRLITTTCYAIKNTCYDLAINTLTENEPEFYTAVDAYLASRIQPITNSYAFHPPLAWQRNSYSDVQNGRRDYSRMMRDDNIVA